MCCSNITICLHIAISYNPPRLFLRKENTMTYEEIFKMLEEALTEAVDVLAEQEDDQAYREFTWYALGKMEGIVNVLKQLH